MEVVCPRCQTSTFQKPQMKLLVNVCGHRLCDTCVDAVFIHPTANCPECGRALRRSNYRMQQFEDPRVDKEVDIRKSILKEECDFKSLKDYNDYLEEIETIVYNLSNGIDIEETKSRVETYKKKNKQEILKIRARISREDSAVAALIEAEKQEEINRQRRVLLEDLEEKKMKVDSHQRMLDELVMSGKSAHDVIKAHKLISTEQLRPGGSSTERKAGVQLMTGEQYLGLMESESVEDFVYEPILIESCGPLFPSSDSLESVGYLRHIRRPNDTQLAGGYSLEIACQRALQDALSGLFYSMT
ncbi:CDK-activating kinase assembly factor MAT1-like isoform X2 [Corticium candelabrum]|uniref:CDK-activating kinase assembly factor MAT1-like isoform X2 n=1 Tax=Corticium candelabrum TaxID=121492 RepID=UPI002E2549F7|nr:CDK-activating kinase assembly factor MAT1-like isoform X2 [Corticium candelabrum]